MAQWTKRSSATFIKSFARFVSPTHAQKNPIIIHFITVSYIDIVGPI